MHQTSLVLMLGLISGVGMLAWAVSGVVKGEIYTKGSGGNDDGQPTYAHLVCRNEEPLQFWVTCATYATVGLAVLAFVTVLFFR